jgi:hypothetical protein
MTERSAYAEKLKGFIDDCDAEIARLKAKSADAGDDGRGAAISKTLMANGRPGVSSAPGFSLMVLLCALCT